MTGHRRRIVHARNGDRHVLGGAIRRGEGHGIRDLLNVVQSLNVIRVVAQRVGPGAARQCEAAIGTCRRGVSEGRCIVIINIRDAQTARGGRSAVFGYAT